MDRLMDLQLIYREATLGLYIIRENRRRQSCACLQCVILFYLGRMLVDTTFIRLVEIKYKDREG